MVWGAMGGYGTRCGHHRRCKPLKRQHRRDGNAAPAGSGARHGLHRQEAERARITWLGRNDGVLPGYIGVAFLYIPVGKTIREKVT